MSTAQYSWGDETIAYYREKVFEKLDEIDEFKGIKDEVISETYMTPLDFESKFNAYNGACFGLRPTLSQSNHLRPQFGQGG